MKAWRTALPSCLLLAGIAAAIPAAQVFAQKPAAKPAAGGIHDLYEPSYRQRLRRESCARDEEPWGPNCVKKCEKGFALQTDTRPPRCRSLKPLPAGQRPGPLQRHAVERPKPLEAPPAPGKEPPPDS
jgi:hypothetical protein